VEIVDAEMSFSRTVQALAPTNLNIRKGEFLAIVGPSGCGKSTLLRMIAGLLKPSIGTVTLSQGERAAFVFQEPGLLPWRNVIQNAELLMELERVSLKKRRAAATAALEVVGLSGFELSFPHQLSGGMRMRLSLARSLAYQPSLLLLDEPLAAVDEITRDVLQEEIANVFARLGLTAILVTHNVYEAVYLANRVVVMSPRPGKIEDIVEIPFSSPRTAGLRMSPEYTRIASSISYILRRKR
jgi:NitT/TauT family transport system ATP-binding protein